MEESEASASRLDRGQHVEHIEVLKHVNVSRSNSHGDHYGCGQQICRLRNRMRVMSARPDLWEPWVVTPRATRPAAAENFVQLIEVSAQKRDRCRFAPRLSC